MAAAWPTLAIIAVGVAIVVGGILFFRLHAFLALILASLVVALITPQETILQYEIDRHRLSQAGDHPNFLALSEYHREGTRFDVYQRSNSSPASLGLQLVGQVELVRLHRRGKDWNATVETLEPLPDLLLPAHIVIHPLDARDARALANQTIGERVANGFGSTCAKIGILIAMASIIGKCLLESGAADRIVRSALNWFGEKAAPVAFMVSGFTLAIPVFFDTVFYLMIPLGKALRLRTGRNYLLYVLTIVCGGTMAHSLVPPTPGPLYVAEEMGVDLGTMIICGCAVGLCTAVFGLIYATIANRIWELPLRESEEFSLAEMEQTAQRPLDELPPLWLSLVPIVLPVVLIAGNQILKQTAISGDWPPSLYSVADTLGNKNIALALSAGIALAMLVKQKSGDLGEVRESVQAALASGGVIILITAAGGAFGATLQQTGVASLIEDLPEVAPWMLITLAFLITTAIRTAQGSSTVAMITAVGILSGIASSGNLPFHPVYLALAIGCGSKPISWMNDSGFWVITKMSGMTEAEGLKFISPMTASMGLVGLGATITGATFFPHLW